MRTEDQNVMDPENDPVRGLLSSMNRVDAPGDFDFRVKARIARGRPVERKASWLPASVRFAAPAGLLLLVGGYFGFNAIYLSNNSDVQHVAPIAEIQQPVSIAPVSQAPATEIAQAPANKMIAAKVDEKSPDSSEKTNTAIPEKLISRTGSSNKNSGGGSYVETHRISNTLTPKGPKPKDKDILSQIGVDASYSNSSWTVGSAKQNSKAEQSGLKTGDVIESVNGKSIRIRRDGKAIQIDLKP